MSCILQHQHHRLLSDHTTQHVHHKLLVVVIGARYRLHHLDFSQEVGLVWSTDVVCERDGQVGGREGREEKRRDKGIRGRGKGGDGWGREEGRRGERVKGRQDEEKEREGAGKVKGEGGREERKRGREEEEIKE